MCLPFRRVLTLSYSVIPIRPIFVSLESKVEGIKFLFRFDLFWFLPVIVQDRLRLFDLENANDHLYVLPS